MFVSANEKFQSFHKYFHMVFNEIYFQSNVGYRLYRTLPHPFVLDCHNKEMRNDNADAILKSKVLFGEMPGNVT